MIENYIFDLYGTLVDIRTDESTPSFWRRMALFLSLQGAAYGPEELRLSYLSAVEGEIDRCSARRPDIPRAHIEPDILPVFKTLYAEKGIEVDDLRARDTALVFRALSMVKTVRLYPHVLTVLETLRRQGKGLYLLSNAQAVFTMAELGKLGLLSRFDGIVLSSDAGVKKPDKAIFEYLLSKYGLRPEACVMIGNDINADMGGAASVGMAGRFIHTNLSPECQRPLPKNCQEITCLLDLIAPREE